MSLKDQMTKDLSAVFFNAEEMVETVAINGVQIPIVWDGDTLNYRIRTDYQGLAVGDALFYVQEEQWQKVPRVHKPPRAGDALLIGKKTATISMVISNEGQHEITIQFSGYQS